MEWLIYLDLLGVWVFALSGGLDAARHQLDILGVMVLAIVTGVGGGIMRDVLLGVNPPAVFTDETYLMVCLLAGLLIILFARFISRWFEWMIIADAIGLGVFAAIGANKAIDAGLGWVGVMMISTISAAGGGLIRDILLKKVPLMLNSDFYASAAILGGLTMWVCHVRGVDRNTSMIVAALVVMVLRFIAIKMQLSLPKLSKLS